MSTKELQLIITSIANSLNPHGYFNVVNKPQKLNETASRINKKREAEYEKIQRNLDEQLSRTAAC